MSLTRAELESLIANRFGELKGVREGFTVNQLEPFIEKIHSLEEEKKKRELDREREELDKKRKAQLVCKNPTCRNEEEQLFEKDERVAQVTCKLCGTVALERQVHDGTWQRQFEGEVNPSQHGPPPDLRFSSAYNLATGVANVPGSKKQAKDIAMMQTTVEMNLSNFREGHEGRTRQGYKDKMKRDVFEMMTEVSESLQLHTHILSKAQTLFAILRNDMEQLNFKYEHAAACLVLALREKQESELQISKQKTKEMPVFLCKYCKLDFVLKRDRDFHVKECDERPKNTTTTTTTDNASKKQKMGA